MRSNLYLLLVYDPFYSLLTGIQYKHVLYVRPWCGGHIHITRFIYFVVMCLYNIFSNKILLFFMVLIFCVF